MQLATAVTVLSTTFVSSHGAKENPLGSVISLIDELTAKITKDGEREAKAYNEYVEWCDETSANGGYAIKTSTKEKAQLEAQIGQLTSDIGVSDAKIEELAGAIADAGAELKDATAIREKEAADFSANEKELVETIDALERAIGILSKEMAKNPASFAQVDKTGIAKTLQALSVVLDAASFSTVDQKRLVALVQDADSDDDAGAPSAAVYKSSSGNIVDVLEDLKEKAEGQLSDLRKAEVNTQHNFDMLRSSLEAQRGDDEKNLDAAKAAKAAANEDKATAEKDLGACVADLDSSKSQLATAQSTCLQVAADHETTVAGRKEELAVIAQAKKILVESTSGAEAKTYSLFQLQTQTDLKGSEVVAAVKRLAKQQHSPALAQLASNIRGLLRHRGGDVFGKVKGLIQNMIAKLEKEGGADATEKAFCDEQMSKTAQKKSELEEDVAKASTRIDAAVAKSATLKEELQALAGELAALAKEQAEMDKIRSEEHADYVAAKEDLELGLSGVRKALVALQEYYGASAAMLQEEQPAKPELHEKSTGAGQSIINILQVVESDFATNLAKEETAEADAAAVYDKVSQENAVTKTAKTQDAKYKEAEVKSLGKTVAEYTGDRSTADTELAAVNEYFDKIKARCIAKAETYADRSARREAEIQGLKQALSILENEAAALLQHRLRGVRHSTLSAM